MAKITKKQFTVGKLDFYILESEVSDGVEGLSHKEVIPGSVEILEDDPDVDEKTEAYASGREVGFAKYGLNREEIVRRDTDKTR